MKRKIGLPGVLLYSYYNSIEMPEMNDIIFVAVKTC
jgi:hypothetical protein